MVAPIVQEITNFMALFSYSATVLVLFLASAFFFSLLVNRLLLKFSRNLGVRSRDDLVRWSDVSKPSVGGLSFYILFLISMSWISLLDLDSTIMDKDALFGLFVASTLGFIIGLADDAYNTQPLVKFLGQLLTANILITSGIYIEITPDLVINYLFSVFWVIAIMNSVNMLDNMDGITASISASIILGIMLLVYLQEGISEGSLILLGGVMASLVGFLFYNWHPSRMFMGDTGSQFLGAFLSGISMLYLWQFRSDTGEYFQLRQFLLPLLAFIIPVIDTTTVVIRRMARGQSPFVGGRDHTTHHLVYLGLREGQVSSLLLAISLLSVVIIYLMAQVADQWQFSYTIVGLVYVAVVFGIFQWLYEMGKARHKQDQEEDE